MSVRIAILRDRLSTVTDLNMIEHIKKVKKELEAEEPEAWSQKISSQRLSKITGDIK